MLRSGVFAVLFVLNVGCFNANATPTPTPTPTPNETFYQQQFQSFMNAFNKTYTVKTDSDFFSRYNTFKANLDIIEQHNRENHSYSMAINEFGDLSFGEFRSQYSPDNSTSNDLPTTTNETLYQQQFQSFVTAFDKVYTVDANSDFFSRYNTFKANLDMIKQHNSENHSYSMAINEFGDLSFEEFRSQYGNCYIPENSTTTTTTFDTDISLPDSIDWRTSGAVTNVKNQGSCGSCWAFSTTGAVEGAYAIKYKKLVDFSEQQLVDCSRNQGNSGCQGGFMNGAYAYIMSVNGECTEAAYPYRGVQGQCRSTCQRIKTVVGYKTIRASDELAMATATATIGPLAVAIQSNQRAFQFYSGGVFDAPCGTQLDHAVLVIGYGTDAAVGKKYWTVKNSWGASWGEKGYIRMARGNNKCGIASNPSYPIV